MTKLPFWRHFVLWNAEVLVHRYGAVWAGSRRPAYLRGEQLEQLDAMGLPRFASLANVLLFAADEEMFRRRDEGVAARDLRRIAFALEDFRDREGHYPETLGGLGAAEPRLVDPFSGEPYRYRKVEKGYRLYSLGADREDDGGARVFDDCGKFDREASDLVWLVGLER